MLWILIKHIIDLKGERVKWLHNYVIICSFIYWSLLFCIGYQTRLLGWVMLKVFFRLHLCQPSIFLSSKVNIHTAKSSKYYESDSCKYAVMYLFQETVLSGIIDNLHRGIFFLTLRILNPFGRSMLIQEFSAQNAACSELCLWCRRGKKEWFVTQRMCFDSRNPKHIQKFPQGLSRWPCEGAIFTR